ncbi:MAG: TonB C-terminal domain-containing protein [bacterium]|nr:MAG: TonB C-terminal domain-containing protein [bacterium]
MKNSKIIILSFIFLALIIYVFYPIEARAWGDLKERVQNELDGNPFLEKEKIRLKVIDEKNGYITIEMYEGNRKVREGVNKGFDIFSTHFEQKWFWDGVSKAERNSLNVLRKSLNYIKRMEGVKEILLTAVVGTQLDHAEDIFYEALKCKNNVEQVKLFRKAAEMGYNKAQFLLGVKYAMGYDLNRDYAAAAGWLRQAAGQGHADAHNHLAWLYATCKDPNYQNGKKAVEHALAAISQNPDKWSYFDTLAAAYARNGQFEEAVTSQKESIELLENEKKLSETKKEKNLSEAYLRLRLYNNKKAYMETSEIESTSAEILIIKIAKEVSSQCKQYLSRHPQLKKGEFNNNSEFRKLAVQKVGKTGFTSLCEMPGPDGVWRTWAHINSKIVGIDLKQLQNPLGENFHDFYKILTNVKPDEISKGHYKWIHRDGGSDQKFMACVPVEGTRYFITATTYVNEFDESYENSSSARKDLERSKRKVDETETAHPQSNQLKKASGKTGASSRPRTIEAIKIYQAEIQYQIQKNWSFSQLLGGRSTDLETVLAIKILRSGEIEDIWFDKKSGNNYLDESAYKAIVKSNPLPPLPKEYIGSHYKIGLIFGPKGLK